MASAYSYRAEAERGGPGLSVRLRVASFAVLVALLPVALAAWAVGRVQADHVRENADAALTTSLKGALDELRQAARNADEAAIGTARLPEIQRALARRNRRALARYVRTHPHVAFVLGGTRIGSTAPALARRRAEVAARGKTLGVVVVSVPRSERFTERLRSAARLQPGDRLYIGVTHAAPTMPGDVGDQRAVGSRVTRDAMIVVARPRQAIEDDVDDVWLRVSLATLATLFALGLIASALAPWITRGRLAQQQRARAMRILSHVADGVFLVDPYGVIRFWNRGAETITGRRAYEVVGRAAPDVIPEWPDLRDRIPIVPSIEERVRQETLPVHVGGEERWLALSGVELPEGVVFTFRDVSEEERVAALRTDFVATVSHQLRTPLASVYGAAMTLREYGEQLSAQERSELLGITIEESERLARIVDEILTTSQLDAGVLPLERGAFSAPALVDDVVRGRERVEIEAPESMPLVAGDQARVAQVLQNLLDNALRYSEGRVDVAVGVNGQRARFAVSDEGPGIPAADRERIFEKFYRLDPQMERELGGTGLGLYICRELVRRMDGRIWVESEPGRGSTFVFELPLAA